MYRVSGSPYFSSGRPAPRRCRLCTGGIRSRRKPCRSPPLCGYAKCSRGQSANGYHLPPYIIYECERKRKIFGEGGRRKAALQSSPRSDANAFCKKTKATGTSRSRWLWQRSRTKREGAHAAETPSRHDVFAAWTHGFVTKRRY